jgi:hypothetical protein
VEKFCAHLLHGALNTARLLSINMIISSIDA